MCIRDRGKTSGKANIRKNLEDLGLDLDEESMRKVTERIIELGDKKELVTPVSYTHLDVYKRQQGQVRKFCSVGDDVHKVSLFMSIQFASISKVIYILSLIHISCMLVTYRATRY